MHEDDTQAMWAMRMKTLLDMASPEARRKTLLLWNARGGMWKDLVQWYSRMLTSEEASDHKR